MLHYFTLFEKGLWLSSVALIVVSFVLFDRSNYFTFISSLLGVTVLIFTAKGNPIGQILMLAFSILYGVISLTIPTLLLIGEIYNAVKRLENKEMLIPGMERTCF